MPPKEKEDMILLDRQVSSMSSVTLSTDLSASTRSSFQEPVIRGSTTSSTGVSWAAIQNLGISLGIYVLGIYYKELLVPPHDEVYTREHPYQQLSSGDTIVNFELNHPLVYPAAVPSKLLFRTCISLPVVIMILTHTFYKSSWNCTLSSVSGLLTGISMCEILTHMLKYFVLRRRPNFYSHLCMGSCIQNLHGRRQEGADYSWWRPWALWTICLVPWSWAAYVACSRIADKWHHASDVVAGIMLGIACALVSYHSLFPHVLSEQAGTSHIELAIQKKNQ
ncbi:PAP2 superfamily [Seminavis robusta]|uniref:PAP2 superfamily n=1 Tax=Seminavis robusta TaxID=568900 RepID=A0A9N8DCW8_9STRA|nr:PAP2 superfamily [Seminavis robusta]|eukprot:Sro95_g049360.1 PAP2 superfamily (279) ;mRNA; f:88576-89536